MKRARWSQWAPTPGSPPALPAIALRWSRREINNKINVIISWCLIIVICLGNGTHARDPPAKGKRFSHRSCQFEIRVRPQSCQLLIVPWWIRQM